MNNWKETTLDKAIELVGGGTPKTSVDEYWNGDIPWLSVVDFNDDSRWVYKTDKTITEEGLKNSSTKLLDTGDLIISARGTVGELAQLKKPMAFNQSCYGIKANENSDINFLYYLIKWKIKNIQKNVHGAVFDTITKNTFEKIDILLPPFPEQKEIAAVLSSLDDKIELLRKENEALEKIAQTIFKEWFVDFKINGKKLKLENGIPEGWRVGKYSDVVDVVTGKGIKKENLKNNGLYRVVGANGEIGKTDEYLFDEDVILTGRVGTLGTVYISSGRVWISDNVLISKAKAGENFHFAYFNLKSFNFESLNRGSTQPLVTQTDLKNVEIIIPTQDILKEWHNFASKIFDKIDLNNSEIQTLSSLRDTLLPRLMSGKIDLTV